jgi:hypothetical protein
METLAFGKERPSWPFYDVIFENVPSNRENGGFFPIAGKKM